ncbi:hypothetical protein ACUH96_07165 [Dermabacteraceae bacterium P13077]
MKSKQFIRIAAACATALLFTSATTPVALADENKPNRIDPCPVSISKPMGAEEFSKIHLTNPSGGIPISATHVSSKIVGYVQQGAKVTGDPGMTISISRSRGTKFSVGLSASATAEAGVLFAKASTTAGVTITNSWTTNRTESGSWKIPNNGRRGWISIGSDKYRVTGKVRYATLSCTHYNKTITRYGISKGASFKRGQF